ncbi:NFAT5 [Acanthosepion pharaonis]|uniref:NFAT5 n=1 Tax=Acanthosepion pharaonis TaxID=158019 RepID=A0A812DLV7_ACAPH|nr:NFAT5 [Sepia pharaonis]
MTEGSRGAVKDQTQQGYPVVQLYGPVQTALLQVFVGTDTGKVKPHPFYQACKVSGKNSTPCTERDIDSTTTIEIELSSTNDLMASIDCVGILKLRNADVEQRIGVAKTKKRSTRARMVFRVIFNRPDGVQQILQVTSSPIVCTQPVGQPEVSRLSLTACSVKGGKDLFIIGKNFMKGTKVFFRETGEENKVIWEKEADIEKDYFQPTHLICVIPEYFNLEITKPVSVNLVVSCSGKLGDPRPFTYQPLKPLPKVETPMEIEPPQPQPLSFGQCPSTLELLRLLQQNPQGGFQVPSEALPPTFSSASTVPQAAGSFSDRETASETKCAFSPSFHEQSHQSDSQFASQLESSSNFHSQTPVQNSPVQSPPQLHSSTQFQSSSISQPPADQGFQQTTQLQSSTDDYLSTTQINPSNQMHSSAMEMHTSDDYETATTQQQQQSPSSQQLNSSLTDFHSMTHQTQQNPLQSLQCQSENQALRRTQFQVESQTQPSAQVQSSQFSQLMSSLPSASAPQIIIVGNPRPVSGRNNVFSLGGNSQQPAPSIFIIPSLSTINENSVSQDNDVLSLLDSLLREILSAFFYFFFLSLFFLLLFFLLLFFFFCYIFQYFFFHYFHFFPSIPFCPSVPSSTIYFSFS